MSHAEVLEVVPINSVLRRPSHIIPLRSVVEIREAKSVEELWFTSYGSKNSAISRPTWVYVDSFAALLLAERRDVVEAHTPLLSSPLPGYWQKEGLCLPPKLSKSQVEDREIRLGQAERDGRS